MSAPALQLELPIFGEIPRVPTLHAVVEVVRDGDRLRVRPLAFPGWVRFPKRLRTEGARFRVERLLPRPGGAWTAAGRIRRLRS